MREIEWLTIAEACRVLKVSRRTLYTYMETGKLDFHQVGDTGHRRIKAEDLDALMGQPVVTNGHAVVTASGQPGRNIVEEKLKEMITSLERVKLERDQLDQELQQLRPLLIWAGHPCALCREPLKGVVQQEGATALLQNLAHSQCIEEQEKGHWFPITFIYLERSRPVKWCKSTSSC